MLYFFILAITINVCLGLINTLFLARIQDLLGLGFELTSKGFRSVFVNGSIQPIRVDQLGLISQNYLNTCKA